MQTNDSLRRTRKFRRSGLFGPSLSGSVLLAAALSSWAQPVFTDNFDSGTLSGWQVRNVVQPLGGFVSDTFPTNGSGKAYRLRRGSADMSAIGQPQAYGTGRSWIFRPDIYTDFYVAMDLVDWNNATNQALVLLGRASGYNDVLAPGFPPGLGTVDGYVCNYDCLQDGDGPGDRLGGQFQINRITGEAPSTIAATDITLTPGHSYRMALKGVGSILTAMIYDYEDLSKPIVTISADDATYTSGVSGIVTFHRDDTTHPNQTDLTIDNYYAGPADPNLDIAPAIRNPLAGVPQVVTRVPSNRYVNFHPVSSGVSFTARTFTTAQINASATKLYLNNVDVSAALAPLPANGSTVSFATAPGTLQSNVVYAAKIVLQDTTGTLKSTNTFYFDTFSDAYLESAGVKTVESEDYNFGGGQFQVDPIPVSGMDTNGGPVNGSGVGYWDAQGVADIDFHDNRTTPEGGWAEYRTLDPVGTMYGNREDIQDMNHPPPTLDPWSEDRLTDNIRKKYSSKALKEYMVTRVEVGEWQNYTRAFVDQNYYVFLRCGSYGAQSLSLDLVKGDITTTNQTTVPLGTFQVGNHNARFNYKYEPLMVAGVPVVVHLSGTNTIRVTANGTPIKDNRLLALNYLLFVPTGVGPTVFDNFNDGNDTTGVTWARYNPIGTGAYSFPGGNTYRIQSAPSPDPAAFGQGRAGSVVPNTYEDFYVAVDVVNWDDALHQVVGVLARVQNPGPGTTAGYMFTHDRGNPGSATSGDMDIVRLDGEVPTVLQNITGSDGIHFEPGKQYRITFSGVGNMFTGKVFELPNTSTPLVEITATDDTYTSGVSGLVVANNAAPFYDGPADATFDNFLATVAEPKLSITVSGGWITVSWPMIPFALQSSSNLTAPWTTVTGGIIQVGDQNVYQTPATSVPMFFRLVNP
jgi:hypothetical protein